MFVLGEGHYLLCMFLREGGTWAELSHGIAPSASKGDPSAGESGGNSPFGQTCCHYLESHAGSGMTGVEGTARVFERNFSL